MKLKKILRIPAIVLFCLTFCFINCYAASYDNYVYTNKGEPYYEPTAYLPSKIIRGEELGIGVFKELQDVVVGKDGRVYILDSGNNRVVILSKEHTVISVIEKITVKNKETKLNSPMGLFVKDELLYIADSGNSRILKYNLQSNACTEFKKPIISMLGDDYTYTPLKIAVDSADRIFVVAKDITNGMIQLSPDGAFSCFFGAIETTPTALEIFWRRFMTKEQLARQQTSIPTEYSNLSIDEKGFIYGTISAMDMEEFSFSPEDTKHQFIRKLNPLGSDVLRRLGEYSPCGDISVKNDSKGNPITSKIIDVAVLTDGRYSLLDSEKGRVFTYSNDGELLYIFGGLGDKKGLFEQPSAIDVTENQIYYIIDTGYNQLTVFEPTEYAKKILDATSKSFNMQYEESEKAWLEVMNYSTGSDIAYVGMGKALLRQGKHEEAEKYFNMGHSRENYSEAFSKNRDMAIKKYFAVTVSAILILILIVVVCKFIRRMRKGEQNA